MSIAKSDLLKGVQSADLNALAAKAGSHVPSVSVSTTGDVAITIPHGKKPTDDHWIQHIFVADCEGDSVKSIVFHREVSYADSDKPSLKIPAVEFDKAAKAATGTLRAFEYCTKDGFWVSDISIVGISRANLLSAVQSASLNALSAKSGSHLPAVSVTGDVTITIPHGKKPTDDHWIQHIFVADCEGDSVKSIVFHREVSYADSDKPSLKIPADEFDKAAKAATGKLRAFEFCTKDGFWVSDIPRKESDTPPRKRVRLDDETLFVKKLTKFATLPVRGTPQSAGYDLAAAYDLTVPAGGKAIAKTDLAVQIPSTCYGRIAPRSSLAWKKHIDIGAGVIDADYRGNVGVVLFNHAKEDLVVKRGERVAQLVLERICMAPVVEVDDLSNTKRGAGGFGSTGK